MVRSDRPNIELVEAKGACLFLIQLVEFGSDIIEIFLQLKPMLVVDEQVLPKLFRLVSTVIQILKYIIEFLSETEPNNAKHIRLFLGNIGQLLVCLPLHCLVEHIFCVLCKIKLSGNFEKFNS